MATKKVLIVEDNPIVAEDLKTTLTRMGYDVTATVYSGENAIKSAERETPDIALMDIRLGSGMNGIDTAERLNKNFRVPVIYITAHADDDTLSRAKKTQPYGYIVKPFDDDELKSVIEIALYKQTADQKIRESQQWLNTTLNSIGDGVIATDENGLITFMNPVAVHLTGWSLKEVAGKPLEDIFQIINEKTRGLVDNPVTKILKKGTIVGLANHTLLITKNGTELPIADSGAPIRNDEGDIIGVVLVFRDQIQERKAEKTLTETTEILKEAQQFAKIGSWRYDPATKMPIWTDEMFHIFGLEPQPEAPLYEEHCKIIHPEDWDRFDAATKKAVSLGIGYNLELRITRPGGAIGYVNARCEAEKNESGAIVRLIGTTQDITDRKLAEIELRKSKENYKDLFENMVQGAFYQSNDGRLLNVNSAALEMFGLSYDQFVGKTSKDPEWNVIHEDGSDFPGQDHPSMVALQTGKPCKDVIAGIFDANRNEYNWVTINAVPQFKADENKPYQVFVTMHDITARKQSEDLQRIQHDLSYQLNDVENFTKGLGICLDSSLKASNMEAGGIYLLNEDTGSIDLVCHKGLTEDFVQSVQHYGPESVHVNILKQKTAYFTEYNNLPVPKTAAEKSAGFKAICIIPILYQDFLIGCITLASTIHQKVPDSSHVSIETITNQIGNWINYSKTKQTLNESEDRFSLAMNVVLDGLYDWDLIKNTMYYSPGWKRMLGYDDSELPNEFSIWEKLTDPQDVTRAMKAINEIVTKKRERYEIEFKMKHKDGHWVDILSRASAIFDDKGTAVRIIGTHVDITERKQAEKRLNDVLQFTEKIIANSPVGLTIYEADSGRCIAANDSIAKLIGGTKEEMLRQNFYTIESWKKSDFLTTAQEVISKNTNKRLTTEITSTFGKKIGLDCYFTQFSFGEKQHLLLTATDVTQKLKAEKTIIRQRKKAERYLNLAGVMFIGLDKDGNINVANKKACQVLEVDQKEVLGQNWFDIFIPQGARHEVYTVFQQIMKGNIEPSEYHENSVVSKTGKEKHIAWHNTAIKNEAGSIVGLLGSGEDITETKQLLSKLQQAQKMESIGTLAGGIAHDFNNILSSVLGFTELALDAVEKETPLADDLQEVYTAGLRAKDLVNQILTFARQSEEKLRPIQIDSIIKEVLKFIRSSLPTTIEIKQNIKSDSRIMASTTQIHQIIMNLCTNAAQAMENEGGILEITLKNASFPRENIEQLSMKPGEYVEIKVSDTGCGIEPHILGRIFDPYFTTKGPGEGTGMGLALVHGIIETYNGKIFGKSVVDKGTVFTIYLPTARESKAHQQYKVEGFPKGQERILLVDDEPQIAKMAGRMLNQLGYSVTTRTSSIEALELFRSKPNDFDLIISDVTMPKMTGDQLTKKLIAIRPDIPVILCTGYSKNISQEQALEIGIKAFAYKPIVKEDLAKIVREVLDLAKT